MNNYNNKQYRMTAINRMDELSVSKHSGSDWSEVTMVVNGGVSESTVTLRSREMAEQLHFMLGQLLRSPNA